jgi:hypothetical protein
VSARVRPLGRQRGGRQRKRHRRSRRPGWRSVEIDRIHRHPRCRDRSCSPRRDKLLGSAHCAQSRTGPSLRAQPPRLPQRAPTPDPGLKTNQMPPPRTTRAVAMPMTTIPQRRPGGCRGGAGIDPTGSTGSAIYGGVGEGPHQREEWDSNPRASCPANGFQDRRLRPLGHPPGAERTCSHQAG